MVFWRCMPWDPRVRSVLFTLTQTSCIKCIGFISCDHWYFKLHLLMFWPQQGSCSFKIFIQCQNSAKMQMFQQKWTVVLQFHGWVLLSVVILISKTDKCCVPLLHEPGGKVKDLQKYTYTLSKTNLILPADTPNGCQRRRQTCITQPSRYWIPKIKLHICSQNCKQAPVELTLADVSNMDDEKSFQLIEPTTNESKTAVMNVVHYNENIQAAIMSHYSTGQITAYEK